MYDLENDELPEMIRDEDPEQEHKEYTIEDDLQADWAVRKIREAQSRLERVKAHYDAQIAKAQAECDNTVNFFSGLLRKYLGKLYEDGTTKNTRTSVKYALPSGTMELKHQAPEFIRDNAKLVTWLEQNQMANYVKTETVKTAQWAELKKCGIAVTPDGRVAIAETGQVIDGITASPKADVFSVK